MLAPEPGLALGLASATALALVSVSVSALVQVQVLVLVMLVLLAPYLVLLSCRQKSTHNAHNSAIHLKQRYSNLEKEWIKHVLPTFHDNPIV